MLNISRSPCVFWTLLTNSLRRNKFDLRSTFWSYAGIFIGNISFLVDRALLTLVCLGPKFPIFTLPLTNPIRQIESLTRCTFLTSLSTMPTTLYALFDLFGAMFNLCLLLMINKVPFLGFKTVASAITRFAIFSKN